MRNAWAPPVVAALAFCLAACEEDRPRASHEDPAEWPTAAPAEVGLDGELLRRMAAELPSGHGIHSALVVRKGKLAFEQYWDGYDSATMHDLRSATKSITSLLAGIAVREGLIRDVSDPVLAYLGAAYPTLANDHEAKRRLSVEDLLTMRTGLACNDRSPGSPGNEERMYDTRDWVRFFLDLPVETTPGTRASYCTGGVVTLGRIISQAGGRPVPQFADDHLFRPLGITSSRWARFDDGRQTDTGGHLYLRPRDMAKIGELVLRRGDWRGAALVPAPWIERSVTARTQIDGNAYGYLWWLGRLQVGAEPVDLVYADGNGGQLIIVVPQYELVAVFTGGNYNSPAAARPYQLLTNYILPAVRPG
jgi:CubicO group peptidase (beta-lactamase class C family)